MVAEIGLSLLYLARARSVPFFEHKIQVMWTHRRNTPLLSSAMRHHAKCIARYTDHDGAVLRTDAAVDTTVFHLALKLERTLVGVVPDLGEGGLGEEDSGLLVRVTKVGSASGHGLEGHTPHQYPSQPRATVGGGFSGLQGTPTRTAWYLQRTAGGRHRWEKMARKQRCIFGSCVGGGS